MFTLLAAAALAASMGGPCQPTHGIICYPGFAPNIHNGRLVTPPPEDESRVYTPGYSANHARLWVGDDVKDIASRRAWRENPGRVAYGAVEHNDAGRVHIRANDLVVTISPWQQVEGETYQNREAARQQWLKERGYTGGVRTFVNPARLRAMQANPDAPRGTDAAKTEGGRPEPAATIRLRKPHEQGGIIKKVDAGVASGVKIVKGSQPVRVSFPMTTKTETVQRAAARGWTESEEMETRVTASKE